MVPKLEFLEYPAKFYSCRSIDVVFIAVGLDQDFAIRALSARSQIIQRAKRIECCVTVFLLPFYASSEFPNRSGHGFASMTQLDSVLGWLGQSSILADFHRGQWGHRCRLVYSMR